MEIYKLRRNAILLDFACIAVAMVVLYMAYRQLLPQWALIVGTVIAAILMCASLWCLLRARKLYREAMKASPPPEEEDAKETVSPE